MKKITTNRVVFLLAAVLATMYGGSKGFYGRVNVNDPYIEDAGSYLTNDVAHVAVRAKYVYVPPETEVMVYAREVSSTNVADWVQLTPFHLTIADHPYDYALPNATNYNVLVAANFVPAPTVHTNGVWQMKGFIIPGTSPEKFAFPNTKEDLK